MTDDELRYLLVFVEGMVVAVAIMVGACVAVGAICVLADGAEPSPALLDAIARVETGGERNPDTAVGDNGRSVGRYAIMRDYWLDGTQHLGVNWPLRDRTDPAKSRAVVRAYLARYGRAYTRATGRAATAEVLARLHNSGPYDPEAGWPSATDRYWRRVRAEMERN